VPRDLLDGRRRGPLRGLPRRVLLTYRHRGLRSVLFRSLVFPLRLTPLDRVLALGGDRELGRDARRWYRTHGEPVTIVIPSYRDAPLVRALARKLRQTTLPGRVRIIVVDDDSGPEHLAELSRIGGIEVVAGSPNAGFSTNVNRGLRLADPRHDVVLLNSDVLPMRGWLAALQHTAAHSPRVGVVGAKLLYPNNRIQYAGTIRNPTAPEWFDHRHRGLPADWGPSDVPGPTLAATGACMYITRRALERVGLFDERYGMGYEDVDYCLRTWEAGLEVHYQPGARLHHHESATRGTAMGDRERTSQRVFWDRWRATFDQRSARTPDGRLRAVYVTVDCSLGGGHRVVFEQLNGLAARGHDVSLWTLSGPPDWFDLRCPVRTFTDLDELAAALALVDAVKVATWWQTASAVWRASVLRGVPVYLVQDIETSYYPDDERTRFEVLDSYRPEFRYLTTSGWNRDRLQDLGLEAEVIAPGVDAETFRPLSDARRREDAILAIGRAHPLKNLRLTLRAWQTLPEPRPELLLFGTEAPAGAADDERRGEPEVQRLLAAVLAEGSRARYVSAPGDREVNRMLNEATVFVQTSRHEGFCLPVLEAMAAGTPVVCTDADGNRDFCQDGVNCLMPEPTPAAVAGAISRLLRDPGLRARLSDAGLATAERHRWPARIDELERWLLEASEPRVGSEPARRAPPAGG